MLKRKKSQVAVTDDDFIKVCEDAARAFCKERKRFGTIDARVCMDSVLKAFKLKFRESHGYRQHDAMKPEHLMEMNRVYERLKPKMEETVKDIAFRTTAEKKTLEIKQTSVSAVIRATFEEAGYRNPDIVLQCYRAKVTVLLPSRYRATFIVKYKDFLAGKFEGQFQEFLSLIEKIESLPFEIKICK